MTLQKKRTRLTFRKKLNLLERLENRQTHETVESIASQFKVQKSMAYDLIRKSEVLKEKVKSGINLNMTCLRTTDSGKMIDRAVIDFVATARAARYPLSGVELQQTAIELAKEMNIQGFRASRGWLQKLQKRYKLKFRVYSGEGAAVDQDAVENFRLLLKDTCKDYCPRDIYNMDETGLQFKLVQQKSIAGSGKLQGDKPVHDRVTVVFAVNALGEKEQPMVIGTAQNPQCFRRRGKPQGITWVKGKKAWMNRELFRNFIVSLNAKMVAEGRHILLFLDNAPTHLRNGFDKHRTVFSPQKYNVSHSTIRRRCHKKL